MSVENPTGAGGEAAPPATTQPAAAPTSAPAGDPPSSGGDKVTLDREAFNDRIARAKDSATATERARLKAIFGTDDATEIAKIKTEWEDLKKQQDEAKRQSMSREQQLEADLATARAATAAAEARVLAAEEDRAFTQNDVKIKRIATQAIAEEYVDDVATIFARQALAKLSARQLDKLTDKDIEKWFADFAKKKPAFARTAAAPAAAPADRTQVKKPLTTGARPEQKPGANATTTAAGKTPRPGQPNSMNRGEFEKFKRERGISY
jgi:hypothetical protein